MRRDAFLYAVLWLAALVVGWAAEDGQEEYHQLNAVRNLFRVRLFFCIASLSGMHAAGGRGSRSTGGHLYAAASKRATHLG